MKPAKSLTHTGTGHSKPPSEKDFTLILDELIEIKACIQSKKKACIQSPNKRTHSSIFLKNCLLDSLDKVKLESWLVENVVPSISFI